MLAAKQHKVWKRHASYLNKKYKCTSFNTHGHHGFKLNAHKTFPGKYHVKHLTKKCILHNSISRICSYSHIYLAALLFKSIFLFKFDIVANTVRVCVFFDPVGVCIWYAETSLAVEVSSVLTTNKKHR